MTSDDAILVRLLDLVENLGAIAPMMHPLRLSVLVARTGGPGHLVTSGDQAGEPDDRLRLAATLALQVCDGLRAAPKADNPMLDASRAMRPYCRALEALAALATEPLVGRFFLEPWARDDAVLRERLGGPPHPNSGVFHAGNETNERGGFSVYVPSWYDPARPAPLIFALHGGSGHGRLFLWNWVAEARSRGMIVVAPTSVGRTWSLMEPDIDAQNLQAILTQVQDRWAINSSHLLLSGMSDGGTFTLLGGLAEDSPFTHLAPVAASFHPMLLAMTTPERLTGLPIHLTHGAQDWMFSVDGARSAHRMWPRRGRRSPTGRSPSCRMPTRATGRVRCWTGS